MLFGWSMGAQIALRIATDSHWASRVRAVVLDSPVLDWRSVLAANLSHAHLPPGWARLAEPWLAGLVRRRMVGLDEPVDLDGADFTRSEAAASITQPVLVHYGAGDWSVPAAGAEAFIQRAHAATGRPNAGGHTTGWNVDPEGWMADTVAFLH